MKKIRILKVLGSISDQIFEKYWMFYRRCQFLSEAINIICFPKNIHKYNFQIVQFMIKQLSNKLKEICRIYWKKKSNKRFWRKKYKTDYFQIRLYIAASKCCFQTARPCFCMNDFWVFSLFYVLTYVNHGGFVKQHNNKYVLCFSYFLKSWGESFLKLRNLK